MRAVARWLLVPVAAVSVACGSDPVPTAPPSTELSLAVQMNPDPTGGMRPSTTVSALLVENDVVTGVLERAEFTVFDGRGAVLANGTVTGPLGFGANRTLTVRQTLDWTPADTLGRTLRMRLVLDHLVIERTFTF